MPQAILERCADPLPKAKGHPMRHRWATLGAFIGCGIAYSAISEWRDNHALLINTSESLPNWAFVIHKTSVPQRGDYVFFVPPTGPLLVRHFGAKKQLFGKIVYGLPGERVEHLGTEVAVNGRVVGRMKPRTRLGEPLAEGPIGEIPPRCYYVGTPHKDGFDSRYAAIGFACARQIVGVGKAIL